MVLSDLSDLTSSLVSLSSISISGGTISRASQQDEALFDSMDMTDRESYESVTYTTTVRNKLAVPILVDSKFFAFLLGYWEHRSI